MTDIDQMQRRLSDLEAVVREQGYRITALEKAGKPRAVQPGQRCECGREFCRAPHCPPYQKGR